MRSYPVLLPFQRAKFAIEVPNGSDPARILSLEVRGLGLLTEFAHTKAAVCVNWKVMRETIIDKPRMSLFYHPIEKIVHHQMHQYPGLELLQEVLMKGLELLHTHGAHKWLSDDRRGGVLPKSHHQWGDKVWSPQACEAGWQYWGLVLQKDVLHTANMHKLVQLYTSRGVTAQVFSEPDEAFAWLRQQRKQPRA